MEPLLIVSGTIAMCVAIGVFLDGRITDVGKASTAALLRSATRHNFAGVAASTTARLFEIIFGPTIGSARFVRRALISYFLICGIGIMAVAITAPAAFFATIDGLVTGDPIEVTARWLLFLAGAPLFMLAAAQTYYILRVAGSDPRIFTVTFLAFADVVLTAAICAVGVGAIQTANTLLSAATPSDPIAVNFRIRSALAETEDRLSEYRKVNEGVIVADYVQSVLNEPHTVLAQTTAAEVSLAPSSRAEQRFRNDLDIFERYLERSGGPPVVRLDEDTVQTLGPDGLPAGVVDGGLKLRKTPETIYLRLAVKETCAQLTAPRIRTNLRFVNVVANLTPKDAMAQCLSGKQFQVRARVEPEISNIDKSAVFSASIMSVVESFSDSLSSLSQVYSSKSPILMVDPYATADTWNHVHVIAEYRDDGKNLADTAFMSGFSIEKGGANTFLTQAVPTSLVVWSIMLTTLITALLFSASILFVWIGRILSSFKRVEPLIDLDRHPFSILGVFCGIVLVIVRLVIQV